ncbi:LOW QUALITY PROTEIN: diamine acetyltransferase 1-like, partial [Strongylocentrotus purpuratus]|uniref:N-acetyltransferase domain-containing protein n=1 Tax=Strongylocentrotus purpuratus TaxID=7668 RepID=A0A7M7N4F2_STRPU
MGFRYVVRQAKPEDCGDILRLIKELPSMKENPDQVVKNTEQGSLMRRNPTVKGTTVAYAMYFCAYSTWIGKLLYLEDLFIQPSHRGKGLGKAMVCKVAQ